MTSSTTSIKPDLGLYQAKYMLRRILRGFPGISALNPNALSLLAIVPGLLAAWCLYQGAWLGAMLCIMARMIVNTLDGLVAEEFNKTSNLGGYLNRLPGEFTDILIVLGLWSFSPFPWNLVLVILSGWVQMMGILGLAAGGTTQSVGPCGQTDRLAIILVGCVFSIAGISVWPVMVKILCFGCGLTLVLRIFRSIAQIRKLDQSA
jgi:CDP-diacylglycerol--glycerol-3-phosphate 3-phosphatidyltransferase